MQGSIESVLSWIYYCTVSSLLNSALELRHRSALSVFFSFPPCPCFEPMDSALVCGVPEYVGGSGNAPCRSTATGSTAEHRPQGLCSEIRCCFCSGCCLSVTQHSRERKGGPGSGSRTLLVASEARGLTDSLAKRFLDCPASESLLSNPFPLLHFCSDLYCGIGALPSFPVFLLHYSIGMFPNKIFALLILF